jgi:hypothetical protein
MPKATQLVVSLPNKPGTLAQLCSALGKAGINITALLAPEVSGRGKIRVLVDSAERAKDALKEAKLRFSEEEVITMELDNRPGAISEVAEKFAQSKVNIKYAYATASQASAKATVVIAVSNIEKALGILGA